MGVKGVAISCACQKSAFQAFFVLFAPKKKQLNTKICQNRPFFRDSGFQNIQIGQIIC